MTLLADFVESRAAIAMLGASSTVETADGTMVFVWQEQSAIDPNAYDVNVAVVGADGHIVPQEGEDFVAADRLRP